LDEALSDQEVVGLEEFLSPDLASEEQYIIAAVKAFGSGKRRAVALDVIFDGTRRMASKLSHGIRRRRIEIRSVALVQSEKELDAPWRETARLELRAPLFDRYRIVADRSPERRPVAKHPH
jgi:hypothetical protein